MLVIAKDPPYPREAEHIVTVKRKAGSQRTSTRLPFNIQLNGEPVFILNNQTYSF